MGPTGSSSSPPNLQGPRPGSSMSSSSPPIELSPAPPRVPLWKRWNCCLPSTSKDNAANNKSSSSTHHRRPLFPDRNGMHHKELSLIVEETESKLRLELESDEGSSKRSLGSSLTSSSSASTGRMSTSGSRRSSSSCFSPPNDLLLTESTDENDDEDAGDEDDELGKGESTTKGKFRQDQLALRGPGPSGSSSAILELAWRVMVSILFLGWLRNKPQQQPLPQDPRRPPSSRSRGRAKDPDESSSSSSELPSNSQ